MKNELQYNKKITKTIRNKRKIINFVCAKPLIGQSVNIEKQQANL